ncbi:transporter substrate-binding domain-containing protein [Pseudooceanicola sp. GBMRC 2024]|uniref:Transporter substrate-binding domain-containing protein n=1 Tax=Pseudooceanicola albus TaxID=2692189 RepID=A0A6L7G178_9RHOB|nr:transporter substrate-binding domain-containing protein [Pseudooceanicola albus]MXN17801.1 transporter substrate-binding domain-containing protein [Pseudooceanicola albus]
MKKTVRFAASAMVLGLLAGTAQAETAAEMLPQKYKDQGYVSVGVEATYPPISFRDPETNKRAGVNIQLIEDIGTQLGVKIKFEDMAFAQLMSGVESGRIDFIGTAISDLPKRRDKFSFVDYMTTGAQPFVLAKNADHYKADGDLCGIKLGAPRTTSYVGSAEAWSTAHCTGDLEPITVIGNDGASDTRLGLMQGRIDAGVLGQEYVAYLMAQEPGKFATAGTPITSSIFGFAFGKDDTGLRDAVAQAVSEMLANGQYKAALEAYGMGAQAVSAVTIDKGE